MSGKGRLIFKPVNSRRTFEDIANQIKDLIYSKALKPHDRLPSERELAIQFNTGRMSVREALRILEESGYITIKKGSEGGIFIRELDSSGMTKSILGLISVGNITFQEIVEARILIETIIIERGINSFTEKQLTDIEQNIINCEKDYNTRQNNEKPEFSDAELGIFHVLLAELSQNRLLKYIMMAITEYYSTGGVKYLPDSKEYFRHLDQHKEILKAIRKKDLELAKTLIKDHISSSAEYVKAVNSSSC
ncbi:MAG: FadR family transcriptional regulator [Spirochaetes bacterium]|nr:FadR family transcriptional regulator [Spirochaetota bacterium]